MTERALVREVHGKEVLVMRGAEKHCFGCMSRECSAGKVVFAAANPRGLPLTPGQFVDVETPAHDAFRQALAAFLPLAAGFIALYAAGALLGLGEAASAAMGVIGGAVSGTGVVLLRRRFPQAEKPCITGIAREALKNSKLFSVSLD
jgi:positive regulator of sigma E activity